MDEIKEGEVQCLLLPDEDDVFRDDKEDLSRVFHIGP
jgi:hypothetical protein